MSWGHVRLTPHLASLRLAALMRFWGLRSNAELRLCLIGEDFVCIHSWLGAIDAGERPIRFAKNAITSGATSAYTAMAGSMF